MKNNKALILGIISVFLFVMLFLSIQRNASLFPMVQEEISMTPSPTPVYGNVYLMTPDPSAPTPVPVLSIGSGGARVSEIQKRLSELGYPISTVDGQYGEETARAVVLFQEQNHLTMDGIVGNQTFSVLFSEEAKPYPELVQEIIVTEIPDEESEEVQEKEKGYVTEDGFPLIVNREHILPQDYQTYELVCLNTYCPESIVKIKYSDMYAEKEAAEALLKMLQAAEDDGIDNWQISAAYRTVEAQEKLFNQKVQSYISEQGLSKSKAISATRKTVADPGTSEHHLGVCFDITVPGVSFGGTKQAKWLEKHCWDYGFILRYTQEKEKITGYLAEPWHYRYVGIEHAKIMQDENLCLEEYIEKYTKDIFV